MTQSYSDIPYVDYNVYLRYTAALRNLPERQAMRYPSVFLQRYARTYDQDLGKMVPLKLEPWQTFAVDDPSDNAIWVKPRQVGFSFLRAARALGNALMRPRYTAVFVSYNRDEAKNKIIYARSLYDSMQYKGKPELKTDNTGELRWSNGSRIISLPAKPVRGYSSPDVFGDEWAFVPRADMIYDGTLSSGSRGGNGTFTVGSTPYGEGNHFFSMWSNERGQYGEFYRHRIEWWYSLAMCIDVPKALKEAPGMTTEQRVMRFGTKKLRTIYKSLQEEDFKREHECSFAARDDTVIQRMALMACCQWAEEQTPFGEEARPDLDRERCVVQYFKDLDDRQVADEVIPTVRRALRLMNGSSVFRLGFDVGRNHDGSMLCIVEQDAMGNLTTRAFVGIFNTKLEVQEGMLKAICSDPRMHTAHIDSTGLGRQLAESTRDYFVAPGTPPDQGKVRLVNFTTEARFEVLSSVAYAIDGQGILVHPFDDLFRHFNSFKRSPIRGQLADNYLLIPGRNHDGSPHHCEIVVAMGLALFGYAHWKPKSATRPADEAEDRLIWTPKSRGYLTESGLHVPEHMGETVLVPEVPSLGLTLEDAPPGYLQHVLQKYLVGA